MEFGEIWERKYLPQPQPQVTEDTGHILDDNHNNVICEDTCRRIMVQKQKTVSFQISGMLCVWDKKKLELQERQQLGGGGAQSIKVGLLEFLQPFFPHYLYGME